MRTIAMLLVVFFAAAPATAAPKASADWRKRQRTLDKQEKVYWDNYRPRLDAMYATWLAQWGLWRSDPDAYKDEVEDLSPLRDLYLEYVDLQDARTKIDGDLAATGDASAGPTLLDALLDLMKAADKLEKEHAEARPILYGSYYDQETGIRLHGLASRVDGLVDALAASEGAVAFLGDTGLAKAKKADKKKSILRRAAMLDALGRTKDDAARAVLEAALGAPEAGLRIVAAENLVPYGAPVVPALRPLFGDPSFAVRRALLESIAQDGADVVAWISPLMDVYESANGLVRARALEALVALTRLPQMGDDRARWYGWWKGNREAVEDGTWKPKEPDPPAEGEEAKPDEALPPVVHEALTTFYGVGVPSRHLVFVLDGSDDLVLPAELEVQKEKGERTWRKTTNQWKGEHRDHKSVLLEQFLATYDAMTKDARLAVVYLWGGTPERVPVFGEKKPLEPSKRTRKALERGIGKPTPQGSMSVEEGLRRATTLCGDDPCGSSGDEDQLLDTVYLVHTGWVGGRFGVPEALVAAFARRNRFHRLQVSAIRIADRKAEAEALMKGLAEVSGGTYRWLETLPDQ